MSEFVRTIALDTIGSEPREVSFAANAGERAALAKRFDWLAVEKVEVDARVHRVAAGVEARGVVEAQVTQACVVTGEPVRGAVREDFSLRFAELGPASDIVEVELGEGELDVLPIEGGGIDLGEAAAQTLALAVEPFPKCAAADKRLREAGVLSEEDARVANSPFAVLKALKPDA